jgi:DNA replication protein DnaC
MGAEKPSEWTMATMYDIINSRIENVLPTIITSNLTFEELEKKVDSRVMSRLSDKDIFRGLQIRRQTTGGRSDNRRADH